MPAFVVSSAIFFLGWFSTFMSNVITYPLDTIRRRVMCQTCVPQKYKGSFDCFLKVTKAEGYKALWKGVWPMALHSIGGGIALVVFDYVRPVYINIRMGQRNHQ